MKKFILCLVTALLLFAGPAFGAWSIASVTSFDQERAWVVARDKYQAVYRIKLVCTSDGADAAEFTLSTYISAAMLEKIQGGALYTVMTEPGAQAPDAAWTVTFDGDKGQDWYSHTTTAADTKAEESKAGSWIVWDMQIDFPDVGSASDIVNLYITIIK